MTLPLSSAPRSAGVSWSPAWGGPARTLSPQAFGLCSWLGLVTGCTWKPGCDFKTQQGVDGGPGGEVGARSSAAGTQGTAARSMARPLAKRGARLCRPAQSGVQRAAAGQWASVAGGQGRCVLFPPHLKAEGPASSVHTRFRRPGQSSRGRALPLPAGPAGLAKAEPCAPRRQAGALGPRAAAPSESPRVLGAQRSRGPCARSSPGGAPPSRSLQSLEGPSLSRRGLADPVGAPGLTRQRHLKGEVARGV